MGSELSEFMWREIREKAPGLSPDYPTRLSNGLFLSLKKEEGGFSLYPYPEIKIPGDSRALYLKQKIESVP